MSLSGRLPFIMTTSETRTLSIYFPKKALAKDPVERLSKLGEKKDRSINYLVVEAILEYLDQEEKK